MTDERGPMLTTRTGSASQHTAWRSTYVDSATTSTGLPSASFYLGAENNGGLWKPAPTTLAGATLGGGLTQSQYDTFRADWDTFENTLSRKAP